jgi:hypothetical protein
MPVTGGDRNHLAPRTDLALLFNRSPNGQRGAIHTESDGASSACGDGRDLTPGQHLALSVTIPAGCQDGSIRAKSDGV